MGDAIKLVSVVITAFFCIPCAAVLYATWDSIVEPLSEIIFGFFGIKDEDVIETQVSSQRLMTDEDIDTWASQLALLHQDDPDATVIEKLAEISATSRARFTAAFKYGQDEAVYGLPESNLSASVLDNVAVAAAISTEVGVSATVLESKIAIPTSESFVGYYLQNTYGYLPYENSLVYNGFTYSVTNIDYNFTNDEYDVFMSTPETITTLTIDSTTVTVTNIDASTDSVNTLVQQQIVVTSSVIGAISDDTTVVSDVTTVEPIGTVVDSYEETQSSVDVVGTYESIIQAPAFLSQQYYIVKYYITNSSEWFYWVYDESTDVYISLSVDDTYISNLDMLPVATIRSGTVNTNSDTSSDLYKDTTTLLDFFSLNLDELTSMIAENPDEASIEDAFIHFGINPTDDHPVISKTLYSMFNFMFDDDGLIEQDDTAGEDKYIATFKEHAMNSSMVWTNQTRVAVNGIIGPLGTYTHTMVDKTLTMNYQGSEESYSTITIHDLSSMTLIDRQGLWGLTSVLPTDSKFFIPLSYHFTKSLSPIEQNILLAKSLRISIYSASITHLEWYETKAFTDLLKVVVIIIIIVVTIYTLGTGTNAAAAVGKLLLYAAVALGIQLALRLVYKLTDNETIRMIATVVAAVATVYFSWGTGGMNVANALTATGTFLSYTANYINIRTMEGFAELADQSTLFQAEVQNRYEDIKDAQDELDQSLGMNFVKNLAVREPVKGYVIGPEEFYYKASPSFMVNNDVLYDLNNVKSSYYDNALRLGILG